MRVYVFLVQRIRMNTRNRLSPSSPAGLLAASVALMKSWLIGWIFRLHCVPFTATRSEKSSWPYRNTWRTVWGSSSKVSVHQAVRKPDGSPAANSAVIAVRLVIARESDVASGTNGSKPENRGGKLTGRRYAVETLIASSSAKVV